MLIGRDDISNDIITLGTCFSMFVYIRACFRFTLIGRNLTAQSTGSHRGIGGGIKNSRDAIASSPSFSHPTARVPQRACSQAISSQPIHAFKSLIARFIEETNTSNDCNSSLYKLRKTLGRRYSLREC